jgi:hypothetical protein
LSRDPGLRNRLLIGALAGAAGALAVGLAVRRMRRDAPKSSADDAAGLAGSLACGAAGGSLLAAANPHVRPFTGALAGAALWVAANLGRTPGLGVVAPATLPPKRRNAITFAAHLLWGAATVLMVRTLAEDDDALGVASDDRAKP